MKAKKKNIYIIGNKYGLEIINGVLVLEYIYKFHRFHLGCKSVSVHHTNHEDALHGFSFVFLIFSKGETGLLLWKAMGAYFSSCFLSFDGGGDRLPQWQSLNIQQDLNWRPFWTASNKIWRPVESQSDDQQERISTLDRRHLNSTPSLISIQHDLETSWNQTWCVNPWKHGTSTLFWHRQKNRHSIKYKQKTVFHSNSKATGAQHLSLA